ncbi:GAF domain-containing protein, partial [bacterium]|nr:GAF domain-containing protein [bacterium]
MYRLRLIGGPEHGTTFELEPGEHTLGRGSEADVHLLDESVSRRHALLTVAADGVTVLDLDSHNGTMINERLVKSGRAFEGDEVRFGDAAFVLESSEGPSKATVAVQIVGTEQEPSPAPAATPAHPPLPTDSRRLAILYDVGNTINATVGLPSLLEQVLASIFEVVPAERGAILLWDEDERRWAPAAIHTRAPADASDEIAVSRSIIEEALATGEPVFSPDARADERFASSESIEAFTIRSAICCPLMVREQRLGVIHLDTRRAAGAFTDDDVRLVGAIANQAAIAIANARLHDTLRGENLS